MDWHDRFNAEQYDRYADQWPVYWQTSRDLVEMAQVRPGQRVVDLACGTGVTSRVLLEAVGEGGQVCAVDMSQAMLELARRKVTAPNVGFFKARGEELCAVIEGPVDGVVCNSAFWQLDMETTLRNIHRVLAASGCFAFNLPSHVFVFEEKEWNEIPRRGLRPSLIHQIARRAHGLELPSGDAATRPAYTLAALEAMLGRASFRLESHRAITYSRPLGELFAFASIPVMMDCFLPGVDYQTGIDILREAERQVDLSRRWFSYWAYFLARPVASR